LATPPRKTAILPEKSFISMFSHFESPLLLLKIYL
jgi:hypothetical protein